MFRKKHHRITPRNVADFLIFDDRFPRSIRHCISKSVICLNRITASSPVMARNAAERQLGRLEADLEYSDIDEVIARGMHEYLDALQTRLNQADRAIGATFFSLQPLIGNSTDQQ